MAIEGLLLLAFIFAVCGKRVTGIKEKLSTNAFIVLFLLCFVFPSIAYLNRWPAFLGNEPFRSWGLVSSPLHWHRITSYWPEGIYYPVAVYRDDAGIEREHLLLDNIVDPINISGMCLKLCRTIGESRVPEFQAEMGEFLVDFVKRKLEYGWDRDSYKMSSWLMGRFSFPTANQHKEPKVRIHPDSLLSIRIYVQPWCKEQVNYRFIEDRIEWCADTPKVLVIEFDANITHR